MSALVTFIVPAFNAATTLGDTLTSLLEQTEHNWRAIIVDDGSTDGTGEIARRLDDPRIGVMSQENMGLSGARNAGVRHVLHHATSDLVCFLDADDRVAPGYVDRMTQAIGDADLVPGAFRMVGENMEDVGWTVTPGNHDFALDRLVHVNPVAPGAVLVRVSSMRRLGVLLRDGQLFDKTVRSVEDWDVWLRASAAGARWAPVVEEPLFDYRMRRGSMSDALRTMHDSSERVIMRCSSGQRDAALRGLRLRTLARATAACDRAFAHEQLAALLPLQHRDIGVLVAALRYAFMFAECIGPTMAAARWPSWESTIADVLADVAALPEVLERLCFDAEEIPRAAGVFLEQLRPDQIPVLYGVGRNGRSFADALRCINSETRMAWVDDHEGAECARLGERLSAAELGRAHFVVVTPDEHSAILEVLSTTGARIETIGSLAQDRPARGQSA